MTEILIIALLAWLGAMAALGCGLLVCGITTAIKALMRG